ncbi:hypothetical protein AB6813_21970 [bacterium RCC_150]
MHGFSAHPQLAECNRWRDVDFPVGPLRSLLPPVTFREVDVRMDPLPEIGEHIGKASLIWGPEHPAWPRSKPVPESPLVGIGHGFLQGGRRTVADAVC